ncbi:MAG: tripartite tricarboxylate transporter substrate-binding protein [Defluviitaleaceae bacterium]|nr:tripartite tricarboxylate transporter substrate-binding protein [Defluviitaleaceae bacterium]
MKKTLFVLFAIMMLSLALAACTGETPAAPIETAATPEPAPEPTPEPAATPEPAEELSEPAESAVWEPTGPITIITHVAPGGGMDVATRLFVDIARQYTDATFVVENVVGGATMIASREVLSLPADGYTIFGAAMSNVNNVVSHEFDQDEYIDGYYWIAKIQRDPAAIIITNEARDAGLDFHGIIEQAREMEGGQIWAVPMLGGNKHFEALLTWQSTGTDGTAVPFESGPNGALAVLGGEAHVQMGNPFDTAGRDLWVAAIASPERMPGFEDSPTFAELGFPELNDMHMWRGYAVRRGTPPEMIAWFQNLVYQVSQNPEWIEYNAGNAIAPTAVFTEEFRTIIQDTINTTDYWLRYLGMLE